MPGRMGKRLSQAPRMSIVNMAGVEEPERKHSVRDFLCANVKTIVTVIMIFGTILCIVLIVMVHQWKFESHKAEHVQACLDVAVIGGGLSGTYTAWRLRHSNQKIHVFDVSDRLGGRLRTHVFPQLGADSGLHAELGALFYLPQRHPLLNRTIHALRLTPDTFRRPNLGQPTFYLRGRHQRTRDLNQETIPYHLATHEYFRYPEELQKRFLSHVLSRGSNVDKRPLSATNRAGVPLYKQGFWNVLLGKGQASTEGFNFIQDTTPWRGFVRNGNAALVSSVKVDWLHDNMATVSEGMVEIPNRLMDEFLNASNQHELHLNRRLGCIRKEEGYYELTFIKTFTRKGMILKRHSKENLCARKVVFAMPAEGLMNVNWQWFDTVKKNNMLERYQTVEPIPALTIYFAYNRTWWRGEEPPITEIITDLPPRWVRYVGQAADPENSDSTNHLFMVANVNGRDVDYYRALIDPATQPGSVSLSCNGSRAIVQDINLHMSRFYQVPLGDIPFPVALVVYDWSKTPAGGGQYMWKRGVKWDSMSDHVLQPMYNENVYVVGSAYCPGQCQLWAEGALQTVETMLKKYFKSFYLS